MHSKNKESFYHCLKMKTKEEDKRMEEERSRLKKKVSLYNDIRWSGLNHLIIKILAALLDL